MKRPTKPKVNNGPANPRHRAEAKVKAEKFIADCEASLIQLVEQESRKPKASWPEIYQIFDDKIEQLQHTYPTHRGKIIIAAKNVRKALDKVINGL